MSERSYNNLFGDYLAAIEALLTVAKTDLDTARFLSFNSFNAFVQASELAQIAADIAFGIGVRVVGVASLRNYSLRQDDLAAVLTVLTRGESFFFAGSLASGVVNDRDMSVGIARLALNKSAERAFALAHLINAEAAALFGYFPIRKAMLACIRAALFGRFRPVRHHGHVLRVPLGRLLLGQLCREKHRARAEQHC